MTFGLKGAKNWPFLAKIFDSPFAGFLLLTTFAVLISKGFIN
jgi:hypothetical protein